MPPVPGAETGRVRAFPLCRYRNRYLSTVAAPEPGPGTGEGPLEGLAIVPGAIAPGATRRWPHLLFRRLGNVPSVPAPHKNGFQPQQGWNPFERDDGRLRRCRRRAGLCRDSARILPNARRRRPSAAATKGCGKPKRTLSAGKSTVNSSAGAHARHTPSGRGRPHLSVNNAPQQGWVNGRCKKMCGKTGLSGG